jgi:D-alanyl-D-alanine carboxypeptidase
MKFQALILSLIIIVALSLNSFGNNAKTQQSAADERDESILVFVNDFYSAASEKLVSTANGTAAHFSGAEQNINQNLASLKQSLAEKQEELFSKLHSKFSSEKTFSVENAESAALISEAKIDPPLPSCNFNGAAFTAKAILVKYPDYNANFFELNPEKRWPIASLTKLMTGVITAEKIGFDKKITISAKAVSTEGTAGNLEAGEIYKSRDLIKAMLVSSSNDAAAAIIENFDEKEFIDEMQKKAAELKMFQTSYLEPTGLSYINQSTSNDLARLANYIRQNHRELLEISRQRETTITDLKTKKQKTLLSVNRFAGQPDFIGGKTGFIEESGRNLIALFEINGKTVLSIVLGAEDSFKETEKVKGFVQGCK